MNFVGKIAFPFFFFGVLFFFFVFFAGFCSTLSDLLLFHPELCSIFRGFYFFFLCYFGSSRGRLLWQQFLPPPPHHYFLSSLPRLGIKDVALIAQSTYTLVRFKLYALCIQIHTHVLHVWILFASAHPFRLWIFCNLSPCGMEEFEDGVFVERSFLEFLWGMSYWTWRCVKKRSLTL